VRPRELRTECHRGHPLTGTNLRVRAKVVNGKRYVERECLECKRLRSLTTAAEINRIFGIERTPTS